MSVNVVCQRYDADARQPPLCERGTVSAVFFASSSLSPARPLACSTSSRSPRARSDSLP
jgi:hypothetical protein